MSELATRAREAIGLTPEQRIAHFHDDALRIGWRVAMKTANSRYLVDRSEIEAASLRGLWKAAETWEESGKSHFLTWVASKIRGELTELLRQLHFSTWVKTKHRERLYRPFSSYIADAGDAADQARGWLESLTATSGNPEEYADEVRHAHALAKRVWGENTYALVMDRFNGLTLDECAERHAQRTGHPQVSRERVRQLVVHAVRTIRTFVGSSAHDAGEHARPTGTSAHLPKPQVGAQYDEKTWALVERVREAHQQGTLAGLQMNEGYKRILVDAYVRGYSVDRLCRDYGIPTRNLAHQRLWRARRDFVRVVDHGQPVRRRARPGGVQAA